MEKFVLSLLALAGAEINEREQVKKKKKARLWSSSQRKCDLERRRGEKKKSW